MQEFERNQELRKGIVEKLDNFEYFGNFSQKELVLIVDDLIDYIDREENGDYDERDVFDCNDDKLFKIKEIIESHLI